MGKYILMDSKVQRKGKVKLYDRNELLVQISNQRLMKKFRELFKSFLSDNDLYLVSEQMNGVTHNRMHRTTLNKHFPVYAVRRKGSGKQKNKESLYLEKLSVRQRKKTNEKANENKLDKIGEIKK